MIAKIKRGNGFRGLLDYALNKEKGELIGGNMIGQNTGELSSEFRLTREMAPSTKNPVWHCSLALPPGERLNDLEWDDVVKGYTRDLGFSEDHQYCIIRHSDTEHDHIHIIASRISYTGELYGGQNDGRKGQKILPKYEKKYGLTIVNREKSEKKTLTRTEREKAKRTGVKAPKQKLQEALDEVLAKGIEESLLKTFLQKQHIEVIFNTTKTGTIRGISFALDGLTFKGSSLGKKYSWNKIKNSFNQGSKNEQQRKINGREVQQTGGKDQSLRRREDSAQKINIESPRESKSVFREEKQNNSSHQLGEKENQRSSGSHRENIGSKLDELANERQQSTRRSRSKRQQLLRRDNDKPQPTQGQGIRNRRALRRRLRRRSVVERIKRTIKDVIKKLPWVKQQVTELLNQKSNDNHHFRKQQRSRAQTKNQNKGQGRSR